jgi:hypothetical protein
MTAMEIAYMSIVIEVRRMGQKIINLNKRRRIIFNLQIIPIVILTARTNMR